MQYFIKKIYGANEFQEAYYWVQEDESYYTDPSDVWSDTSGSAVESSIIERIKKGEWIVVEYL